MSNSKWYAKPEYNDYREEWVIIYHREGSEPWRLEFHQGDFHANPQTSKPRQLITILENEYDCEFVEGRREPPWTVKYYASFTTKKKCLKALRFIEAFFLAWHMENLST